MEGKSFLGRGRNTSKDSEAWRSVEHLRNWKQIISMDGEEWRCKEGWLTGRAQSLQDSVGNSKKKIGPTLDYVFPSGCPPHVETSGGNRAWAHLKCTPWRAIQKALELMCLRNTEQEISKYPFVIFSKARENKVFSAMAWPIKSLHSQPTRWCKAQMLHNPQSQRDKWLFVGTFCYHFPIPKTQRHFTSIWLLMIIMEDQIRKDS